jgi:serine/threonine protein kinase
VQDLRETLPIGSIVGGRYLIDELLGRGGFGAVYRVSDQRVHQNLFALKEVIDPNKRERDRFTFEAELLKRVDHPALPRVYRVFEDNEHDRAYMLMDFIDGPNLEKLRQQQPGKRLALQQVLAIMGPITEAVAYLHDQHPPIIHRDIKPANIIVPTSGEDATLVDFGIAKEFDPDSTTTAIRHASPGYGAPEQYATGTNTRTDIYGLGATIYALLTGIVPADAFYRTTQLGSRGTDPLEPIQRYAPGIPQPVSQAIYRAMAVDVEERFPTVQDFWRALNAGARAPVSSPANAVPAIAPIMGGPLSSTLKDTHDLVIDDSQTTVLPGGRHRRKVGAWLFVLLTLLIALATAALALPALLNHHTNSPNTTTSSTVTVKHSPTATHRPQVTSTPSPPSSGSTTTPPPTTTPSNSGFPALERQYNGMAHNATAQLNANMSLTSIKQQGKNIQGTFLVNSPLSGDGPFTGTVSKSSAIQFVVHSSQVSAPLYFQGTINGDGSMSGTYCSLDATNHCNHAVGGYGTWQVSPLSPGSFSMLYGTLPLAALELWSRNQAAS